MLAYQRVALSGSAANAATSSRGLRISISVSTSTAMPATVELAAGGAPEPDRDAHRGPAEADHLLSARQLSVHGQAAHEVGRVCAGRGEIPAARIPAAQPGAQQQP